MSTLRADTIIDSGGGNNATINGVTVALASQAEAEAGTNNTKLMTPLRVAQAARPVLGVSVASTSGASIDFTGIPSWVKLVTVSLDAVSTNGSAQPLFQLGTSGGVQTTGYEGRTVFVQSSSVGTSTSTSGMTMTALGAASVRYGTLVLTRFDSGNVWIGSGIIQVAGNAVDMISGRVSLSGVLDRVRVAAGGADTFDAGSINVMWE